MGQRDQFCPPLSQAGPAQSLKPAVKVQVLRHGQFIIEGKLLRHVTDQALDPVGANKDRYGSARSILSAVEPGGPRAIHKAGSKSSGSPSRSIHHRGKTSATCNRSSS